MHTCNTQPHAWPSVWALSNHVHNITQPTTDDARGASEGRWLVPCNHLGGTVAAALHNTGDIHLFKAFLHLCQRECVLLLVAVHCAAKVDGVISTGAGGDRAMVADVEGRIRSGEAGGHSPAVGFCVTRALHLREANKKQTKCAVSIAATNTAQKQHSLTITRCDASQGSSPAYTLRTSSSHALGLDASPS